MTTNISQAALGPACASAESFSSYSIHLDNSERVFLLAVLCEYELLLRKASRVLGYVDLDSRADIARPLFERLSGDLNQWGDFCIESAAELSELRVALEAACDLVASYDGYDYDIAVRLRTAIRNKLAAAPIEYDDYDYDIVPGEPAEPDASSSVQTVQQALPFFGSDSAPAQPEAGEQAAEPVESAPRFEVEPYGDDWVVIGYWADGVEAFRMYSEEYDEVLEAGEAFLERECQPEAEEQTAEPAPAEAALAEPEPVQVEPAAAPAESAFTDDEYEYLLEYIHDGIAEAEHSSICKEPDHEKAVFLQGLARSLMGPGTLSLEQRDHLLDRLRSEYKACKSCVSTFLEVYERTEHDRKGVWDNLRLMDLCLSLIGKLEKQYQTEEV